MFPLVLKSSTNMSLYCFLLFSYFIGGAAGDKISPEAAEVSGREGESVRLKCVYETDSNNVYLHWYKHHSNQAPQFILWKGARSQTGQYIPDNRYQSQTWRTSAEVTIRDVTVADSALYYCALGFTWVTWVSWVSFLTFGKGIRLSIHPTDSSPVSPTISILRPLQGPQGSEGSKVGPQACLAASFRPKDGQMVLDVTDSKTPVTFSTSNSALSTKTKTYFYTGFSDQNITACRLHIATAGTPTAEDVTVAPPSESKPSFPTQQCHPEAAPDVTYFSPQESSPDRAKLNWFLMLFNGVRIVFTKTVAFNTILTIRTLLR